MTIRILLLFVVWASLLCVVGAANYEEYVETVRYILFGFWCLLGLFCCYAIVGSFLSQGTERYLWIGCAVFTSLGIFVGNSQVGMTQAPAQAALIVVTTVGQQLAPAFMETPGSLFESMPFGGPDEPEEFDWIRYENLVSLIDLGAASVMSLIGAFVGAAFASRNAQRR